MLVFNDGELHGHINNGLEKSSDDVELIYADNSEKALSTLDKGPISLIVSDITMDGLESLLFLFKLNEKHPETPCIVITSSSLPIIGDRLLGNIFQFYPKPVLPQSLMGSINRALQKPLETEQLSSLTLADILYLVQMEGKSCILDVHADNQIAGSLFLSHGRLFNASYGNINGEEAAGKLLIMDNIQDLNGQKLGKNVTKSIHRSVQTIINEAVEQKGGGAEHKKIGTMFSQQQYLIDEGIRYCEQLEFTKAQKPFATFVRNDPENALGWLWLSRSLTDMKKIKKSLSEAHRLQPEHINILEEIKKVHSVEGKQYTKLIRCPFCYTPIDHTVQCCHYCKSNLLYSPEALSKIESIVVRRRLVMQAFLRFKRVLAIKETNAKLLFYTGTACLNLGNLNKALSYFKLLMPIISEENRLSIDSRYKNTVETAILYIQSNPKYTPKDQNDTNSLNGQKQNVLSQQSGKKTVLVVEDSPTTRKVIKMTLQNGGFRVVEAADGVEALIKLNDEQPGLVLLDIMLPKIDGYNVLSILKKNKDMKNVPVIMLTSKKTMMDKMKGRLSAANSYITKPFKPEELVNEVRKHIN